MEYTITKEQVERASRREGVSHPVITVLETYSPRIEKLNNEYLLTAKDEKERFVRGNYGFLADAFEDVGSFTMEPLDIVAIWSKAIEIFSHRYKLAAMVSCAYAIGQDSGGPPYPELERLPRFYLEQSKLPAGLGKDSLLHFKGRLDNIHRNQKKLYFYAYGTDEDFGELAVKSYYQGDEEAKQKMQRLLAHAKEHKTHLLEELGENFANGLTPLTFELTEALESQ